MSNNIITDEPPDNQIDPRSARAVKRAFDEVFKKMDAPDYPATCYSCGEEGTNATMATHVCPMTREFVAELNRPESQ